MSRRTQDLLSAGVLGAFGLVFLFAGRDLPITAQSVPGPGLFPLLIAVVTVVLAIALAVKTWRLPQGSAQSEAPNDTEGVESGTEFSDDEAAPSMVRPLVVWLAVLGCVLILPSVGFLLSSVLLMAVLVVGIERKFDPISLITVVALPFACYEIFAVLLDVRLPTGLLG